MAMATAREQEGGGAQVAPPSPGLTITLKDLTYTVKSSVKKGEELQLLSGVSAFIKPGELTALMGPSGSGKTTLLDILAGRKTVGNIQGEIRFGGVEPTQAFLRRHTAYVEQFDTLIGTLTVREMLMYTAELKRPLSEPRSVKAQKVDALIERLGLTSCADVHIGDPLTKGISGGQAKRVNIGIALISDPRVLFLDEPTSGLDSFSANEVVDLIRGLARSGVTVVATIHSPTAAAFAMFDRVLMLVRGSTAFFGPNAGNFPTQFAQQFWPGASDHPSDGAAAEFLVDMVTQADRSGNSRLLTDAYAGSTLRQENDEQLQRLLITAAAGSASRLPKVKSVLGFGGSLKKASKSSLETVPPVDVELGTGDASDDSSGIKAAAGEQQHQLARQQESRLEDELATTVSTATPWWWGLWVLLKYRAGREYQNPAWVLPRATDKMLFAIIILTLYLQTGDDFSQGNLVNLGASLFMWTTLPAFGSVGYVPSIVLERRLFYRERADGCYHVGTYLLYKMIGEVALAAVISIVFSAAVFYAVDYQGSFLLFWLVYLFTLANGIALGYLVAAVAPNLEVANAALPALVTVMLFFAGQLAVLDTVPKYWSWVPEINFMRYAWSALMGNQFSEVDPEFSAGQSILSYYSIRGNPWGNTFLLLAFFAVFTFAAYLSLSFIRHTRR